MNKLIDINEAQKKLPQLAKDARAKEVRYILTENKEPVAVIISYQTYLKWREPELREISEKFNKLWEDVGEKNTHISEEEVEADLKEVTKVLRERRRNESGSH